MGKIKNNLLSIFFMIVLIVGVSIMLYPTVSNYINSKHQSRAIAQYDEALAKLSEADYTAFWEAAVSYNEALAKKPMTFNLTEEELKEYYNISQNVQQNAVLNRAIIDAGGIFPWLIQCNNKQERTERLINMSTFFGFAFLAPVINVPLGNRITMKATGLTDKFFDRNCNAIQLSNKFLI